MECGSDHGACRHKMAAPRSGRPATAERPAGGSAIWAAAGSGSQGTPFSTFCACIPLHRSCRTALRPHARVVRCPCYPLACLRIGSAVQRGSASRFHGDQPLGGHARVGSHAAVQFCAAGRYTRQLMQQKRAGAAGHRSRSSMGGSWRRRRSGRGGGAPPVSKAALLCCCMLPPGSTDQFV